MRPAGRLGVPVAVLLAGAGAGAVAGCGGHTTRTASTAEVLTQPYPPAAQEPPPAPRVTTRPAGRVVRVGPKPEGVAADPRTHVVAVAVQDPPRLVLLDGRTGRTQRVVRLDGTARHVQLAHPGGPFLVPAETADELEQVPEDGGRIVRTHVGANPHDATQLGDDAYVVDEFDSTIERVHDGRVVASSPVAAQPGGVAAVRGALAVSSVRAYTVELLSAGKLTPGGAQSAGTGPSHVVSDAAGRLYVADTRGQQLIVYATRPRLKFVARVLLGGSPLGLAVDEPRGRLWVTLAQRNVQVELTLADRPSVMGRMPTVRQPNSNAVDTATGRLFVASRTDGTLELIDPR